MLTIEFINLIRHLVLQSNDDINVILGSISPNESPFYKGNQFILYKDQPPFLIIDQYGGKAPFLFDKEFLINGKAKILMRPEIILDSNVASAVACVLNKKPTCLKSSVPGQLIQHLLHRLHEGNKIEIDINPTFYYVESLVKSDASSCIETAKGILIFQVCDKEHLFYKGAINKCAEKMELYYRDFGTYDIEKIAKCQIDLFGTQNCIDEVKKMTTVIYIILMRKVIIKSKYQQFSIERKVEELYKTILKDIGVVMARELVVGILYFANVLGNFIGIEKNMGFEKAKRKLISSAWDLFLLRIPEFNMIKDNTGIIHVGYACTAEKKLQELAVSYKVRFSTNSKQKLPGVNRNLFEADYSMLKNKVESESLEKISFFLTEAYIHRAENNKGISSDRSLIEFNEKMIDVENDFNTLF